MNRFAHRRPANALVTAGTHSSSYSAANFPHVWATDERLCSHWTRKHLQYLSQKHQHNSAKDDFKAMDASVLVVSGQNV